MLISEAIEALLIATRADGRSSRMVESYRQKLAPLVAFLGNVSVSDVTTDDLRRFIAHLMDRETLYADHPHHREQAGSLSPFTIASHVRATKWLFNFCEAEGILETNPARRIKTPQPKRQEPKGIAWEDFVALLRMTDGGSVIDL